jgi:hypothetical protein
MESENKDYPTWICGKCGFKYADPSKLRNPDSVLATWHSGKCDVCGEVASVTEPRDFGYPVFPDFSEVGDK